MSSDQLTRDKFLVLASQYANATEFKNIDPRTYYFGRIRGWLHGIRYHGTPTILLPCGARVPTKKKNFIFHAEDFL